MRSVEIGGYNERITDAGVTALLEKRGGALVRLLLDGKLCRVTDRALQVSDAAFLSANS